MNLHTNSVPVTGKHYALLFWTACIDNLISGNQETLDPDSGLHKQRWLGNSNLN